jgi:hypothetical protein
MYKHANRVVKSLKSFYSTTPGRLFTNTLAVGVPAVALVGGAAPAIAKNVGQQAAQAAKEEAEEGVSRLVSIGIPTALIGGLTAARTGLFGEKAEAHAKKVTDKVMELFGSKGSKSGLTPGDEGAASTEYTDIGDMGYKLAVAKTYHRLKTAEYLCSNSIDRDKIAAATEECAKILFDCVYYR